ncbi:MAG: LPS assembly protein LptD [Pseudomonadota bacterium]
MYNKNKLKIIHPLKRLKQQKSYKLNKLLFSAVSSFALIPLLHANELIQNNWNCQQVNNLWHCAGSDTEINTNRLTATAYQPITTPQQNKLTAPVFTAPIGPTGGTAYKGTQSRIKQNQTVKSASCATPDSEQAQSEINQSASNNKFDFTTRIEADQAVASNKNIIDFEGDVVITHNDQRLTAKKARYNKTDELFNAQGDVIISQPGVILKGERANYLAKSKQGRLDNSSYQLPARPAQGVANNIQFKPGLIELADPTFSSCPANAEDWVIKASEMELHTEEGYGEGEHVVVYFKGIPFIYSPYIRFPLNDERTSGFLLPEIGYSSRNGADFSTPYYWNIAPNMDATITPRILSKRGFMLGSQFRYMSKNQYAELYAEYLNDNHADENRDPEEVTIRGKDISENRGAISFQHQARLSQSWNSNIDYNYVSDNYYIDDFGNNLKDRSETHLLREGNINFRNEYFSFTGRAQGYQELKKDVNTYSRLPQLLFSGYNSFNPAGIPLGAGFISESVRFEKNWDYDKATDEGTRYHIRPYLDMPFNRQYGYIKPRVSVDFLQYDLDETATIGAETSINRTLPIFSLDSGLYFEKQLKLFNTSMTNTLEPRLFYLYVPHEDQNNQPVFDSSLNQFTFSQLFRENRFSGIDRLADANQLSFALTSRFFDNNNGYERFRASIGQIVYFQDREVQLNKNTAIETADTSAIAAELASQFLPHWNTSFSMMYNPHQNEIDTSTFRLQYKSDSFHIVNFDYSYKNDASISENYDQLDLSSYWKIAPQWHALARWNYSLQDDFTLESMLGFEYDSCCYAMRLVLSREQAYLNDEADNRIMLQMQFKGLASVGNISDTTLRNDIPGFERSMDE